MNLSWKQKLIAVTTLILLGLIALALSAFFGLNSVGNSFDKKELAVQYEKSSLAVLSSLLKLESNAPKLNAEKSEIFLGKLSTLKESTVAMQALSVSLANTEVTAFSDEISSLVDNYIEQRTVWLNNRLDLGFSSEEGQLDVIAKALIKLEKSSSAFTESATVKLASQQRKYLNTQSQENEKNIEAALVELNQLVVQFKWQDYPIGKIIRDYETAYKDLKVLVTAERNTLEILVPLTSNLMSTIDKQDVFLEEKVISEISANATNASKVALQVIAAVAVIVGLITFWSLSKVAHELNVQLSRMQDFLKNIAKGDFSKQLSTNDNENDEFTQLHMATNKMVNDISSVISQVVKGNHDLLIVRNQLEEAVDHLGITSVEVEQKTEQSTVATQQISVAVNDVAKRSVDVSDFAQSASKATQSGGGVVNDCVVSMQNISQLIESTHQEVVKLAKSSSQMLGIIDVINGLADQTNLLALNAAIESARAGEAGRGFSVVADEVRALAQKTVNATTSIGDIIKNFNDQSKRMGNLMEQGIKLASSGQNNANDAVESFGLIDEHVQKVAAEMDQVVVAVEEISHNTNDIAAQIEHIGTQTEGTKTTRHTLTEYTNTLSSQADSLEQLTNRFTLRN